MKFKYNPNVRCNENYWFEYNIDPKQIEKARKFNKKSKR